MIGLLLLTALITSLLTVLLIGVGFQYYVRPRMEQELEARLKARSEKGLAILEERIEKAVKRGVVDGVAALASKEVLQDTTRNLARSGAELVEDRLSNLLGRRRRYMGQGNDE